MRLVVEGQDEPSEPASWYEDIWAAKLRFSVLRWVFWENIDSQDALMRTAYTLAGQVTALYNNTSPKMHPLFRSGCAFV